MLAIPFNLLAVAIALNLFLGGWHGETTLFGLRLKTLSQLGFFAAALTLGGLAFLNTWDILVGAALIVFAYVLAQVRLEGWSWARLEDVFALGFLWAFLPSCFICLSILVFPRRPAASCPTSPIRRGARSCG